MAKSTNPSTKNRNQGFAPFSDSWAWEFICLALCICSCVALAVLLAHYDGHDVPLLPHDISLNTVAAVLATAAKAFLLVAVMAAMGQNKWLKLRSDKAVSPASDIQHFDEASRGPLGSFMLLFRGRNRPLAILGALIIILSVAFEPFVQQAITYPLNEKFISSQNARMPIAKSFKDSGSATATVITDKGLQNPLSDAADSLLHSAALGVGSTPLVIPSCPTSNCTWANYTSLALCSSCIDVTESARGNVSCDYVDDVASCNYTLPDGSYDNWASTVQGELGLFSATLYPNTSNWIGAQYAGFVNPLLAFEIFWEYGNLINETTQSSVKHHELSLVLECAVTFCLKTYNSTISDGTLSTSLLSTTIPPATEVMGKNSAWELDFRLSADSSFKVDNTSASFLGVSLIEWFGFSLAWGTEELGSQSESRSEVNFDVAILVNNTNDFPRILDRTVQNFTAYMANISSVYVTGSLGSSSTQVKLTWYWLIFPFALVSLGIVFVVVTVLETKLREVVIWKDSSVALLYHGLDRLPDDGAALETSSAMEKKAGETKVRLGRTRAGGWKLLTIGRA